MKHYFYQLKDFDDDWTCNDIYYTVGRGKKGGETVTAIPKEMCYITKHKLKCLVILSRMGDIIMISVDGYEARITDSIEVVNGIFDRVDERYFKMKGGNGNENTRG